MTFEKVLQALGGCEEAIKKNGYGEMTPRRYEKGTFATRSEHLLWMIQEVRSWDASRIEKAFRWLGFIQGAMWMLNMSTIDELKNMNKPEES